MEPGGLLRVLSGIYGLKEASRLYYQHAHRILTGLQWRELASAKSVYVLDDPRGKDDEGNPREPDGFLALYVDDGLYF